MPFDADAMQETIITQKVENLLGVLEWDLASATDNRNTFESLFSF
jgi:hypothetical protein